MDLDQRLKSTLEKVAQYFNFKSWTYIQRHVNDPTENYFGVLIPVTINGIRDNGAENRSLYVKIPPLQQPESLKGVIRQHYEVEIYTYTTLLPIYRSITNVDTRKLMPECYYTSLEKNNEVIVLQDMACNGYKRYVHEMVLDFEHVIVSLKALAKFHSLSMIYKEKNLHFETDVMKPYTYSNTEMYNTYIRDTLNRSKDIFGDTKYYRYIKNLSENLVTYIDASISEVSLLVYGHGDFWRENILFKYDNNKPIEACILDFQKSRIMSPAQDILMFLIGNIDPEVGRKHNQHFLEIYLEELHCNLKDNGVNKIILMENLVRDMSAVSAYSSAISIMGFSLWLGLEKELVKSKKSISDPGKAILSFKTKVVDFLDNLSFFGYITL